jgi:predicted transcriptional regulator
MPAPKLKAEEVEAKLRELAGNYSAVARALGVTRSAVSLFVKKRPKLKAVAEECRETFVDNVESAIYKEALNGNVTAQIFILKTLGKSRGYIERVQIENDPIDWDKVPDDILDAYCEGEMSDEDVRRAIIKQSRKR